MNQKSYFELSEQLSESLDKLMLEIVKLLHVDKLLYKFQDLINDWSKQNE